MTGRKENLRDFITLENDGVVKFRNNNKCKVKEYEKVTNGKFTVNRLDYVEVLKHNLISVSQLIVGTWNHILFDEDGHVISNKEMKEVLLKSKRKCDMFTLNIKPIVGLPLVCKLSNATSNLSRIWNQRPSHLNYKNMNKVVFNGVVCGLPVLKFNNDSLCVACEQGKQHR